MNKIITIIISILISLNLFSQEIFDIATTENLEDSIYIESTSIPIYEQEDIEIRLLEHTLAWLDTTGCDALTDTVTLPDSIYIARLSALPYLIEMPYNSVVRSFIDMYVIRRPKQVARLLTLSEFYFPIFEEKLCQYNLPDELKFLPIIESALNPTAYSRVGAAGLWQFMPSTAKTYGLEVNSLVDERLDPIKSTEAACRFLTALYRIYGDWNLVIAAYNCGPGNVNKAIKRANGKRDFWAIWPYLPPETRSYIPIFIAANYALNYADSHNICMTNLTVTLAADTIVTSQRLHLQQVSEIINIDINELRRLNPQYRRDILPGGKPYTLCLPIDMTGAFIQFEDTIYKHKADSLINNRRSVIEIAQGTEVTSSGNGTIIYTVKKGDTLSTIAKKYHTTVAKIKKINGLKSDNLKIGQKLRI